MLCFDLLLRSARRPFACREPHGLIICCLQGRGVPGTAVQWGAWGGSGMAVRTPGFMERMARMGLGTVQPFHGVSVLAQLLQGAWRPLGSPLAQHALFVGEPAVPSTK